MYRIKSLILLLISLALASCLQVKKKSEFQLSVSYISGEYDGLLLSNQLKSYLNNFGILNANSNFQVQGSVSHSSNLFITNIDNTSDREKSECFTYSFNESISQFYVLAGSDKFSSNRTAIEEIKSDNTEYFVKRFINSLTDESFVCNEEE